KKTSKRRGWNFHMGLDSSPSISSASSRHRVTPKYEAIHAFFEANRDRERQPWVLKDFIVESDRRFAFFLQKPRLARYFDKSAELIYNPDREGSENDWKQVLTVKNEGAKDVDFPVSARMDLVWRTPEVA